MSAPSLGGLGVVLRCRPSGEILAVVHQSLGEGAWMAPRSFVAMLAPGSRRKGLSFLADIVDIGAQFGSSLFLELPGGPELLDFRGVRMGADELLVMGTTGETVTGPAARNREAEAMAGVHNDLARLQRDLAREHANLRLDLAERNRMVAMASHDLRNALHAISLNARVLLEIARGRLEEREIATLERIEKSGAATRSLLEDLMTIAKPLPGQAGEVRLDPTDLHAVVESVVALFQPTALEAGATIRLGTWDAPTEVSADEHGVRRVIENLVGNAVKYGGAGATIEVEAATKAGHVVVSVRDDGPGIDPELLPHLFRPFTRGTAGKAAGVHGHGLGLAICRRLIDAHGGWIRGLSDGQSGSTFEFGLRLTEPEPR